MSILDLGTGPSRSSMGKKSSKIFMGFGLLIAVIGIGSTFASTISINANQNIEFGQGVQKSIFCGGTKSITVTPISSFANSEELGTFGLTGITVSDIPDECSDRDFVVKVYNSSGTESLVLAHNPDRTTSMALANVWWANGCTEGNTNCRLKDSTLDEGYALLSSNLEDFVSTSGIARVDTDDDSSFTLMFLDGVLSSNDVKKIVIETKNDSFGFEQCLVLRECVVNS